MHVPPENTSERNNRWKCEFYVEALKLTYNFWSRLAKKYQCCVQFQFFTIIDFDVQISKENSTDAVSGILSLYPQKWILCHQHVQKSILGLNSVALQFPAWNWQRPPNDSWCGTFYISMETKNLSWHLSLRGKFDMACLRVSLPLAYFSKHHYRQIRDQKDPLSY